MKKKEYLIMYGESEVACIFSNGVCSVYNSLFLPYSLYLQDTSEWEETDIDLLMDNLTNFYFWCASRILTLDRKYAKEILNSIGTIQPQTDRDRAQIALSYHCLSLTDIYWVKEKEEEVCFSDINLYENHLNNAFVDIALHGKQMTVANSHLIADDLSTNGIFPKAWIREGKKFFLLKNGKTDAVENEILASKICQCFKCRQVIYEEDIFDEQKVSKSEIFTSLDYSIVSREAFEIFAVNRDINALDYILKLDSYTYYMMNILDYLVGNTDRHWGNWGLLIDNINNKPVCVHNLMDFNQSFQAYDTIDGANCMTLDQNRKVVSQREAAEEAVKEIGLNQVREVKKEWFGTREKDYEMFEKRLKVLRRANENAFSSLEESLK